MPLHLLRALGTARISGELDLAGRGRRWEGTTWNARSIVETLSAKTDRIASPLSCPINVCARSLGRPVCSLHASMTTSQKHEVA